MYYSVEANNHGLESDPFTALITPRPIGWISTVDEQGVVNLAPYSFFNLVSENPHYVMFSSKGRKDSLRNVETQGEFVCSLATFNLRDEMLVSSFNHAPDIDEMSFSGLNAAPSTYVKPPRVKESPVALECIHYDTIALPNNKGEKGHNGAGGDSYAMVIGKVVGIYIDDSAIKDGMVDMGQLRPMAVMGYSAFSSVQSDNIFRITPPK